jgi:hypothetical protein
MPEEIATDVYAQLARLGRPTTPDELRVSHVRRLVTIDAGELNTSLTRVLTSTLIERVQGDVVPHELALLVNAAERELRGEICLARVRHGRARRRVRRVPSKHVANAALLSELAHNGRSTTPDDLIQRGLQRVPMIGLSEMSSLIERAVNRALLGPARGAWAGSVRTTDVVVAVRTSVTDVPAPSEAESEALSASRRQVAEYRRAVEQELTSLRNSIAAHRGFAEQQENVDAWPLDPERRDELKLRVHARLMPIFDQLPRGVLSERSVVADLLAVFAEERAIELAAARRAADAEVEQLERRIAKLVASLEANESLLESVIVAKAGDPGVASRYREVQGLDEHASEYSRRAAIMERIFEANVELQKQVAKEHER